MEFSSSEGKEKEDTDKPEERIRALENEIFALRRSMDQSKAPNPRNAEEELNKLEEELDSLRRNLVQKLPKE